VVLQLLALGSLIAYKQVTLVTGQRIVLKTVPVDPRDMFRGDYVVLRYEITRLQLWQCSAADLQKGDTVYVTLHKEGRFWTAGLATKSPPEDGRLFIRGRVAHADSAGATIEYGIESYFVPEGKGRQLERAAGDRLTVEVAVDHHGRAAIRSVQVEPAVP
jgi:uncharacterized membrane-anchored protein